MICLSYRGFSLSDGDRPSTQGIFSDIEAMTEFFEKAVEQKGGSAEVQTILWGKSFGCATAIVAKLSSTHVFENVVLESPFTNVPAVYRSLFPCLGHILARITGLSWDNLQRIL